MPHQFSAAETALGVKTSAAVRRGQASLLRKVYKLSADKDKWESTLGLLSVLATNPAFMGVVMYGALSLAQPFFAKSTVGGNPILAILAPVFAGLQAAEVEAMKVALIIYVASGGNLLGVLQAGGTLLGDLMKAIGPGAAALAA